MSTSQYAVLRLYNAVIDDVIHNVSDSFLDEGVDEQVLQELKQMWTTKMMASKAVAQEPTETPPPNVVKSGVLNKAGGNKGAQANGAKSKGRSAAAQQDQHTNGAAGGGSGAQNSTSATAGGGGASSASAAASGSGASSSSGGGSAQNALVTVLDPYKLIPIQITLPPQGDAESRVLTIQLPGSVIQNNQLGQMLTAPVIQSIMNLPPPLASSVLQQHVNTTLQNNALQNTLAAQRQLDGAQDSSDEGSEISDADVDPDDDDEDKDDDEDLENEAGGAEEEPLNSEDDVTDEDAADLFETDNVIVCQYDKITRSRNKWKFHLKDGIMSIGGKDYVFQRSNGDAEW